MKQEKKTKKIFINYPVDYIIGHLRYGHKEGIIEMTEKEYKEFQKNPAKWLKEDEDERLCDLELLVDDWEIDEYDSKISDVQFEEVN